MELREFLTVREVTRQIPVSFRTVQRWIQRGLPVYQSAPKAKVLIRRHDLEQFLKKGTRSA